MADYIFNGASNYGSRPTLHAPDRPYASSSRATFAWSSLFGVQGLRVAAWAAGDASVSQHSVRQVEYAKTGFVSYTAKTKTLAHHL